MQARKHKNQCQDEIFIQFMEKNSDIARGFTKGDRVAVDAKWIVLARDLNGAGPPIKDVSGWKKAWCDWNTSIKKKLAHNKKESLATGGGPFDPMVLSDSESTVANLCGMFRMVDGIDGTRTFGPPAQPKPEDEPVDECPPESHLAEESPAKRLRKSQPNLLEEACTSQNRLMERVVEAMNEMTQAMRTQTAMMAENHRTQTQLMAEHNAEMLRIEKQKLEALQQFLNK